MQRPATAVRSVVLSAFLLFAIQAAAAEPERKYAPFSEYEMERSAEIALARSAAPERISSRATIKVLTRGGFEVAVKGDNGFQCLVMRSWSAAPDVQATFYARLRAPICFDPIAARTVAPVEELRTTLGLEGKQPEAIAQEVAARYGRGQLPKMEGAAFAYMWSASQDTGPGFGAWHPHMMVYVPYYENSMLGGNEMGGHAAPFVVGEGTPFSIALIVVDDSFAIKAGGK
ncbi:MAG TPA: hypothetical protein VIT67_22845 [Povalibacter sp.]